ncbi:hypothetical protein, partial [Pseudomonas syringae group genomosp. 7]|uniref:hypothetical protein n=1 Tax=Pseudomonas syringae group genomosp. 7 TaxID=251699 RepID=UPI00376FAFFA
GLFVVFLGVWVGGDVVLLGFVGVVMDLEGAQQWPFGRGGSVGSRGYRRRLDGCGGVAVDVAAFIEGC